MLNLWAHVIGGFSWKHFQFSVCPSGEARPNSLKLYVLLARPAPDQTCIPGPFSVCPTSGNVKQACPPLHLTERVLPGPPTLSSHTLNDLRTSVLVFSRLCTRLHLRALPSAVSGLSKWGFVLESFFLVACCCGQPRAHSGACLTALLLAGFL